MSIKVYGGYRLSPGTDLFAFCDRARKVVGQAALAERQNTIMRMAMFSVFEDDIAGEQWPRSPLDDAITEQMTRPDPVLHHPQIVFVPCEGEVLAITYDFPRLAATAWVAMPEVEEYGYWNNADRPEGVTDEEWVERERVWGEGLRLGGQRWAAAPSQVGLTLDLAPPDHRRDLIMGSRDALRAVAPQGEEFEGILATAVVKMALAEQGRTERASGLALAMHVPWRSKIEDEGLAEEMRALTSALKKEVSKAADSVRGLVIDHVLRTAATQGDVAEPPDSGETWRRCREVADRLIVTYDQARPD